MNLPPEVKNRPSNEWRWAKMSENPENKPTDMPEDPASEDAAAESTPPAESGAESEIFVEEPEPRPELPPHPERNLDEAPSSSPADMDTVVNVKQPSRFQTALRRILIWFTVMAVMFLGGFLTYHFVLHQPVADELETAQAEVTSLQTQVESATSQLAQMEDATQHRDLLLVMVDVYDARLALTEENVVAAKSALADTADAMDRVLDEIEAFDSNLAAALPQRLALILSNLDRDTETAIADCDQLLEDLLEVEAALFN
jgi:hypothetical protein